MAEPKTACRNCRAVILVTTAGRNDGLCAPCYQAAHPYHFPERSPAESQAIEEIRDRMLAGCSAEEFAAFRCPRCGGLLSFVAHPCRNVFEVRCDGSTTHLRFDGSVPEQPAWWSVHHREGGWIFE